MSQIYAVAIGSNQPRSRRLTPEALVERAVGALSRPPFRLIARSPVIGTSPIGPSKRRYANAAALVETELEPEALLALLKRMENAAGRRAGQRWRARPLDLDIVLWDGGCRRTDNRLTLPHPRYRERSFVLDPLVAIIPGWRDPMTGRTVRQEHARLKKPRKLPEAG